MALTDFKMTDEDIGMMLYFVEDKGDITRWCDYQKHRQEIEGRFPDLVSALAEIDRSKKHLRWAIRDIKDKLEN